MTETWKDVTGYEGLYQVSSLGKIKSLDRSVVNDAGMTMNLKGKILSAKVCGYRYAQVGLQKNGSRKVYSVHRLVAQAFIPNPYNYDCVNHKDHNIENNCVDNLEWCTQEYNNQHRKNTLGC